MQRIIPSILSALTLVVMSPSSALAQFTVIDADVYSGGPELQVEFFPGQQYEVYTYATIDLPVALYTIISANRFNYAVLGTFQCNAKFEVLKTHHNGFYDIQCVDENVFNEPETYVLKYNGTRYIQKF